FQLPVHPYPEAGEVNEMGDYDHFRPWLWTTTMRFSYGTMKGRGDADWQAEVAKQSPEKMLEDLNRYGFAAVLVNRAGYKDHGSGMRGELERLGYQKFIEQPSYIGFKLRPAASPELPFVAPYAAAFGKGFYGPEIDGNDRWHW